MSLAVRRVVLVVLALVVAALVFRSLAPIQREPGRASSSVGGTEGSDGRVPLLLVSEMVAGRSFTLDVLWASEWAEEIWLVYSTRESNEDVSGSFGEGALLGPRLRPTPGRGPGYSPSRALGVTETWHRSVASVPAKFVGRTIWLQAMVQDPGAEGGFALSPPISLEVRGPGAVFHVSPTGDDADDGSEARPFRTLGTSVGRLRPGDELVVHGGEYAERVVVKSSGTPSRKVRIRAGEGETPVVTGQDMGLWLKEAHDVVIEGLTVRGTSEQGIRVDRCERIGLFRTTVEEAFTNHGIQILASTDVWLEEVSVRDCGDLDTHHAGIHVGDWSERVWIVGSESHDNALLGIGLYRARDCLVHSCTVTGNIEGIIAEEAPGSWIVSCTATSNRNGIGTDGNRVDCPGMRVVRCTSHHNLSSGFTSYENPSGTLFYRNLSHDNGSPWGHGFWVYATSSDTFLHNTSLANSGSGFALEGGTEGVLLANNVSAWNGASQLTVLPESVNLEQALVSLRNLFFADGGPVIQWGWDLMAVEDLEVLRPEIDDESLTTHPLLVPGGSEPYAPSPISPCIDAGTWTGRPHAGKAPDLGRVERD